MMHPLLPSAIVTYSDLWIAVTVKGVIDRTCTCMYVHKNQGAVKANGHASFGTLDYHASLWLLIRTWNSLRLVCPTGLVALHRLQRMQ